MPLKIIRLIKNKQTKMLGFVYQQMELGIEKRTLNEILGLYKPDNADSEFEDFGPEALKDLGLDIKS